MNTGWIKLHRKFLEWEWYDDINTKILFLHCLLKANHKDKKWRGNLIKRGSFITSLSHLSDETGLSIQNIRTSFDKLESTGEVNKVSTSVNTCVTITNYDDYQDTNKEVTSNQQTTNKRVTTTKNVKNVKNEKNIPPEISDVEEWLIENKEFNKPIAKKIANEFYSFYEMKNWKVGKTKMSKWEVALGRSLKWDSIQNIINSNNGVHDGGTW